jgi:hypothetical protein
MGFRRSDRAVEWVKWVTKNRDALTASGVPDFVLADESRWWRFLGHGYDGETGWKASMLRPDQLVALTELVEREFGTDATMCLPRPTDKTP